MASVSAAAHSGCRARNLLQFLRLVGQLKRVPRTGWVYRNVKRPESVSDHMYRMAVMALMTSDDQLNKDRCVRLALVHDMAECIVGDIAPADNIPKEEKHRREEEAMKHLTQLVSRDLGKELYELWEEYETQSSPEAKFVKELDQCEMILQASEYEDLEQKPGRLQDFFDSTAGKFNHPEIVQLVTQLEAERNANIAVAAATNLQTLVRRTPVQCAEWSQNSGDEFTKGDHFKGTGQLQIDKRVPICSHGRAAPSRARGTGFGFSQ